MTEAEKIEIVVRCLREVANCPSVPMLRVRAAELEAAAKAPVAGQTATHRQCTFPACGCAYQTNPGDKCPKFRATQTWLNNPHGYEATDAHRGVDADTKTATTAKAPEPVRDDGTMYKVYIDPFKPVVITLAEVCEFARLSAWGGQSGTIFRYEELRAKLLGGAT